MRKRTKQEKKALDLDVGGYVRRITLVTVLLCAFLAVCLARVGYLQLVCGKELAEKAEAWQISKMKHYAKRGKILDRNGNVLAITVETMGVQIFTPQLDDPDYVIDYIAGVLAIDGKTARKKVLCKKKYCYVARFLDPKIAEPLERVLKYRGKDPQILWHKKKLSGVQMVPAAGRLYPFGDCAGQVVGWVSEPPTCEGCPFPSPMQLHGKYGIEAACNDYLAGKRVDLKGLKRQKQGMSLLVDNPELVLAGDSVLLTIDVNIQAMAEEELRRAVITSLAKRGMVVVMEVQTGELLAVAHYPPFNPNGTSRYGKDEMWKWNDAAFIEIYEPGSTIKPLILAAAKNEGVIAMDDLVFCENGKWRITNKRKPITDHGRHEFLTIWDCLKYSSNICLGKVGLKLGSGKLYEYMKLFGFGERTGAKPNKHEARGLINKRGKNWTNIEIANIAFGQGIAVTAVQLVTAVASLGNRGRLMKPMLVKEILDNSGKALVRFEPEVVRQVVSEETARTIMKAMTRVLEPGGTGTRASVFGFEAAGKTGTAQKVMTVEDPYWTEEDERDRPARRSVYVDKWVASFVGLAPAGRPRLAVLVVVDEPYLSHEGGLVAAPVFSRLTSRALTHLNEIPASETEHTAVEADPVDAGRKHKVEPPAPDGGQVSSAPGGIGPAVVPDLAGMTAWDAVRIAWESRLKLVSEGSGVVIGQEPAPQAVAPEWAEVRVRFGSARSMKKKDEEQKGDE